MAGFLTAFFGTAMMLLEGREHLFSHDFGQGTPEGLWELLATALVFSVGYILVIIIGHTLFGLAWSGYALWAGREPTKR